MGMVPFHTRAGEVAFQETRSATTNGWPGLPDAEYGFVENYCDDIRCDCRRVLINAISAPMPGRFLATINYGWESPEFYAKWMHSGAEDAKLAASAVLEPLEKQTEYAPALLELFKTVLQDAAYVERLKRHYEMFKEIIRQRRKLAQKRRRRR